MFPRLATPPTDWASGTWASAARPTRPHAGQICLNFYVPERSYYSLLLISNKFCDLSLLHWQCGKKNWLHWALKARYDTALQPVKVTRGSSCTLNHLWTSDRYDPVRNAFDAGKSITWASGRGLGPKWHPPGGWMLLHRPKKVHPPPACPRFGFVCIKCTMFGAVSS